MRSTWLLLLLVSIKLLSSSALHACGLLRAIAPPALMLPRTDKLAFVSRASCPSGRSWTLRLKGGFHKVNKNGIGGRRYNGVEKPWKGKKPWIKRKTLTEAESRKKLNDERASKLHKRQRENILLKKRREQALLQQKGSMKATLQHGRIKGSNNNGRDTPGRQGKKNQHQELGRAYTEKLRQLRRQADEEYVETLKKRKARAAAAVQGLD
mmetsp:Transcript_12467/g.19623  ORF Transcript_12467/g.19623 Transcript_12467/m.19623 type:complete len:210 (+) Transcript_12467:2-631(+)